MLCLLYQGKGSLYYGKRALYVVSGENGHMVYWVNGHYVVPRQKGMYQGKCHVVLG